MGEAGGARGVWGYVQGGMGELSDAIERALQGSGRRIRREVEVARINISGGRAVGVRLADGTQIDARAWLRASIRT